MTTPITLSSIARLAAPVLVAGALAAGCGTVAANPGGPNQPANGPSVVSGSASPPASGSGSGSGSAPPTGAQATPVPTFTGGLSDPPVQGEHVAADHGRALDHRHPPV